MINSVRNSIDSLLSDPDFASPLLATRTALAGAVGQPTADVILVAGLTVIILALLALIVRLWLTVKDIENDMALGQAMLARDAYASQRHAGSHTIACFMRALWRLLAAVIFVAALIAIAALTWQQF